MTLIQVGHQLNLEDGKCVEDEHEVDDDDEVDEVKE